MLNHALLSWRTPHGKRTRELASLVTRFLANNVRHGGIVRQDAVMRATGAKAWETDLVKLLIAQRWLAINQDAPLPMRLRYRDMLEKAMRRIDPDVRVLAQSSLEDMPRQAYITRERAQQLTRQITAPFTKEFVKVYESRVAVQAVPVSHLEEAICRVRDAYITAPIGDMPAIGDLLVSLGYTSSEGQPLKALDNGDGTKMPLTEAMVRTRQLAEDWRGQRGKHVVRAFDIIPEELKLVAIMRAAEMARHLFQHAKALSHIFTNYYRTGEMPALANKDRQLNLKVDPTMIASMTEAMNRIMGGGGERLSITLNQTTSAAREVQAEGAKADVEISHETKSYLARMSSMSETEIEAEIAAMEQLRQLLANGGVTGETATAQGRLPPPGAAIAVDSTPGA